MILLFTWVLHVNGWGQQILVQEEFNFLQHSLVDNIVSGHSAIANYDNGSHNNGATHYLMYRSTNYIDGEPFIMNLGHFSGYDSVYVEMMYTNTVQISYDNVQWEEIFLPYVSQPISNTWVTSNTTMLTDDNFYLRVYSDSFSIREIDNILIIGYGEEASYGCNFDANNDGNIGAQDLLAFLEVYGTFVNCD
jgi:hypothetical protein